MDESTRGGLAVCERWWLWMRPAKEAEASRRIWDEFERTRPLRGAEVPEEDSGVRLETPETAPLGAGD
jgi:hypothetical protein